MRIPAYIMTFNFDDDYMNRLLSSYSLEHFIRTQKYIKRIRCATGFVYNNLNVLGRFGLVNTK